MHSIKGFQSLILLSIYFLHGEAFSNLPQDACRLGPLADRLITSVQVVKHTIRIVASVVSNTTLQINNELTIPVSNAPANLDVLTTYDVKSTYLSIVNASVLPVTGKLYSRFSYPTTQVYY